MPGSVERAQRTSDADGRSRDVERVDGLERRSCRHPRSKRSLSGLDQAAGGRQDHTPERWPPAAGSAPTALMPRTKR